MLLERASRSVCLQPRRPRLIDDEVRCRRRRTPAAQRARKRQNIERATAAKKPAFSLVPPTCSTAPPRFDPAQSSESVGEQAVSRELTTLAVEVL
jgi:hypothetical protein